MSRGVAPSINEVIITSDMLYSWSILSADLSRNSKFYTTSCVRSPNLRHCCWHLSYKYHVTTGGHVTLCTFMHVSNAANLFAFWWRMMNSFHEALMTNESLSYLCCIRSITGRWQVLFTYDWHLTDQYFENKRHSGVHTHINMEVARPAQSTKIADDWSLKLTIWMSNLYWNSCLRLTDDKYTIAFQIHTRITEILVWICSYRKWPMLFLYTHVHSDHVVEGSSSLQCRLVAEFVWRIRTNMAS